MMAASAKERDDIGCANATGGTSTAYTVATSQVYDNTTHLANKLIGFTASLTCGASPTLNVDGLGAFPIVNHNAVALGAGAIVAGGRYLVSFDLSNFYLLNGNNGTLDAPSGTLMLFQQTSAPTGWTKQSTHNDKALRVVTGSASSGGSNSFSGQFASTSLGTVTIAQANLPSYNLSVASITATQSGSTASQATSNFKVVASSTGATTNLSPGASSGAGSFTGDIQNGAITITDGAIAIGGSIPSGGGAQGLSLGTLNLAVAYVDVIIASKN